MLQIYHRRQKRGLLQSGSPKPGVPQRNQRSGQRDRKAGTSSEQRPLHSLQLSLVSGLTQGGYECESLDVGEQGGRDDTVIRVPKRSLLMHSFTQHIFNLTFETMSYKKKFQEFAKPNEYTEISTNMYGT